MSLCFKKIKCVFPKRKEIVTPPEGSVVSLEEMKVFLRRDPSDTSLDAVLSMYIETATLYLERWTGLVLRSTGFKAYLDYFPPCVKLQHTEPPSGNYTTVTAVKYVDNDGVTQTLATSEYDVTAIRYYTLVVFDKPCAVLNTLAIDVEDCEFDVVTIEYTAGYGTGEVPDDIKLGIMMMVSKMFYNSGVCEDGCGNNIPCKVQRLLSGYKPAIFRKA